MLNKLWNFFIEHLGYLNNSFKCEISVAHFLFYIRFFNDLLRFILRITFIKRFVDYCIDYNFSSFFELEGKKKIEKEIQSEPRIIVELTNNCLEKNPVFLDTKNIWNKSFVKKKVVKIFSFIIGFCGNFSTGLEVCVCGFDYWYRKKVIENSPDGEREELLKELNLFWRPCFWITIKFLGFYFTLRIGE